MLNQQDFSMISDIIHQALQPIRSDIRTLQDDMFSVKGDIKSLQDDSQTLRLFLENDIRTKINILAEGHASLNDKLDIISYPAR